MPVAAVVSSSVPVIILPDATARIDEPGLRAEFERMLEHTLETAPNPDELRIRVEPPYDTDEHPVVLLSCVRRDALDRGDRHDVTWNA